MINDERLQEIKDFMKGSIMNTEVTAETKNTLPANLVESAWGSEGATNADMIIPKLQLMQPMSELVGAGKATVGDIVESLEGETIAKKGASVEVIPILTYREWWQYEILGNEQKWKGKTLYGPQNADWKYEGTENGIPYKNDAVINVFFLLPSRLNGLPYLISFRRSSFTVGKRLSTHFQIQAMKKMPAAATTFKLSALSEKNDKGTFWVYDIARSRETKKEELTTAYEWYKTITHKAVKADDADEAVPF